jgi:hypothetical protein
MNNWNLILEKIVKRNKGISIKEIFIKKKVKQKNYKKYLMRTNEKLKNYKKDSKN